MQLFKKINLWFIVFLLVFSSVSVYDVEAEPEAYQFENSIKSDTVDLSTGDMSLNIPLFDIPQPGGDPYPIFLTYKAGIKLDQSSSWVGLGWDLGVDSISRQVNHIPDDAIIPPGEDNYKMDSHYPSHYPSNSFFKQIDQAKQAHKSAQMRAMAGIGMSIATGFTPGLLTPFSANLAYSGLSSMMALSESSATIEDMERQLDLLIAELDLTQGGMQSKSIDGLIYSNIVSDDESTDYKNPDEYFVSSYAYSGPLVLLKDLNNVGDEAFIPTSFSGNLEPPNSLEFFPTHCL